MTTISRPIRILAISGSLRASSANTAVLRALADGASEEMVATLYGGLANLPHFNPDLDRQTAPPPVEDLRRQLGAADGILISCPEYAHGVPGVMKNMLDWTVSSGEFVGKPVALVRVSSRSNWAQASLTETLTVMMARLVSEVSIELPASGDGSDLASRTAPRDISLLWRSILATFSWSLANGNKPADTLL